MGELNLVTSDLARWRIIGVRMNENKNIKNRTSIVSCNSVCYFYCIFIITPYNGTIYILCLHYSYFSIHIICNVHSLLSGHDLISTDCKAIIVRTLYQQFLLARTSVYPKSQRTPCIVNQKHHCVYAALVNDIKEMPTRSIH